MPDLDAAAVYARRLELVFSLCTRGALSTTMSGKGLLRRLGWSRDSIAEVQSLLQCLPPSTARRESVEFMPGLGGLSGLANL